MIRRFTFTSPRWRTPADVCPRRYERIAMFKGFKEFILAMISQVVGQPNFDSVGQFKLTASATEFVQPGTIITAVVNFLLVAAAVYFAIVLPMNKLKERLAREKAAEEAKEVTDVQLLTEIRDLLSAGSANRSPRQ